MGKFLKQARSNEGQASVMIGMMMLTFIFFFAFVVNTGMLVNAKINLQNAADLAAYAGAATQARQLNDISYLNYEMRRQYKKFLFRYYVMGNMAQKTHPSAPGPIGQARNWSPDGATIYGAPAVCLIFNSNDNYCQLGGGLPDIAIPGKTVLDAINETLRGQLQALEGIRVKNCGKIADSNLQILELWLYNTDPDFSHLTQSTSLTNDQLATLNVVKGTAFGLGLVPRELILLRRLQTLESYVNTKGDRWTKAKIDAAATGGNSPPFERSILAFRSAYNTLGDNTFDPASIELDEMLPAAGDSANLLALQPILQSFDTYAVTYEMPAGVTFDAQGVPHGPNGTKCDAKLLPITTNNVPVGVGKDPHILTYYSVRLKATAKLMFSPFGDIDLKAYAAAQPFGSRIGPAVQDVKDEFSYPFLIDPTLEPTGTNALNNKRVGKIPNLPVLKGDASARGKGWDTTFVIGSMYQAFFPGGAQPNASIIDGTDMELGYQAAMAPNPTEGFRYNIPNDLVADPFVRTFDAMHTAAIWAPVVTPDKMANLKDDLRAELTQIFQPPQNPGGALTQSPQAAGGFIQAITDDMLNYVARLTKNQGENGEGINLAAINDPFTNKASGSPIKLPPEIFAKDPALIRTSYVSDKDKAGITQYGRVGYSVKFVSFKSLTSQKQSTNGSETFSNDLPVDEEATPDVPFVQH